TGVADVAGDPSVGNVGIEAEPRSTFDDDDDDDDDDGKGEDEEGKEDVGAV
ncbi:hypothetical protein BGZ98_004154, partial [Dissophora globulifera]